MRELRYKQESLFLVLLLLILGIMVFQRIEFFANPSHPLTVVSSEPQEDGGLVGMKP